jgi:tripartite-type tricarboxylate transporter receptor subunit TctC
MVAPAGVPKPIIDRLNAEIQKALKGEAGKQLSEVSLDPLGGTPADFAEALRNDSNEYARIIKAANIQPQ